MALGVSEGTAVAVAVGVGEGTVVAVAVGVGEGTAVAVAVGVGEGTAVAVAVGVGEGTAVAVSVGVGEGTAVAVGVSVGLGTFVPVAVGAGAGTAVIAGLSEQAAERTPSRTSAIAHNAERRAVDTERQYGERNTPHTDVLMARVSARRTLSSICNKISFLSANSRHSRSMPNPIARSPPNATRTTLQPSQPKAAPHPHSTTATPSTDKN